MDGILPVYKPRGITSYDVIRQIKKILPRGTKIGHAGTLDPFAEGVLLILLGKATKSFDEIQKWPKTYVATARVGSYSDTLDREGKKTVQTTVPTELSKDSVVAASGSFVGEIEQVVPAYSAAKYRGRKRYEYARRGTRVPEKSKQVMIYAIEVGKVSQDSVGIRVVCSSGTYIRQLSYDILKGLGWESYLDTLVREAVGEIKIDHAVSLTDLEQEDEVEPHLWPAHDE